MQSNTVSLYIHVPFCAESKCDYCDFYSLTDVSSEIMDAYVKAVIEDIKYQLEFFNVTEIATAYIGGGTPSVLGNKRLEILLRELNKIKCFKPAEFTIEVNPESAAEDILSLCKEAGVNRISVGVQSFHEPSRLAVSRAGETSKLYNQLKLINKYFYFNLSADLITGLPFQTKQIVKEDIDKILEFNPSHISLYSLTAEKGTVLEKKIKSKTISLSDTEEADDLWLFGREILLNAGFDHYEISNFSREGKRCLHNLRYWQMENWIGAGPAASGTIVNGKKAKRYTYYSDLMKYLKNPSIHEAVCEELESIDLIKDTILMGYRTCDGPDRQKFKSRFGFDIEKVIGKTLKKWENKDKMLFLNSFLREAFAEIDAKMQTTAFHF